MVSARFIMVSMRSPKPSADVHDWNLSAMSVIRSASRSPAGVNSLNRVSAPSKNGMAASFSLPKIEADPSRAVEIVLIPSAELT